MMDTAEVRLPAGWKLEWVAETDSTNQAIRQLPAQDGLVLGAEAQTAGRGRRGNEWQSGAGLDLTFSVLLRPPEPPALWPRLALAAGVAVAGALESFGIPARVKWPNDVLAHRRKICGILVEAVGASAVVGIGLNVNGPAPRDQVQASSMQELTGNNFPREEVLSAILAGLDEARHRIDQHFPLLLESLRARCALTGHHVSLLAPSGEMHGLCRGIGPAGELLVQTAGGVRHLIQADHVRIVDA